MDKIEIPFSTNQYEKRLIIFIDLIGFSDFVLSNQKDDKEKAVKELTSYFQSKVSEGAKYIHQKGGHSFKPTFNFFSDTIMVSLPLELFNAPEEFKNHPIDIDKYRLLTIASIYICDIQLHSLKHGLLTRGCVTIGDVYHNKNTWFGPGIIEAHHYESKIAIYPRVILSPSSIEYFTKEIATDKNYLLFRDHDSYYYINYIAWIHKAER